MSSTPSFLFISVIYLKYYTEYNAHSNETMCALRVHVASARAYNVPITLMSKRVSHSNRFCTRGNIFQTFDIYMYSYFVFFFFFLLDMFFPPFQFVYSPRVSFIFFRRVLWAFFLFLFRKKKYLVLSKSYLYRHLYTRILKTSFRVFKIVFIVFNYMSG